jgi:hypothetical protein
VEVDSVSDVLSNDYVAKVEALNSTLSTDIKTEIEARTTADTYLSNTIDKKVLINDISATHVNIKKVTQ